MGRSGDAMQKKDGVDSEKARRRGWRRWAGWRLLVVVVLMGLGVFTGRFYLCYHWPMGEGPAGPMVGREAFAGKWRRGKVMLLGIGDSITSGFGASPGYGYFDRLVKTPEGEFEAMRGVSLGAVLPGLEWRNMAVSGSDSFAHVKQIEEVEVQGAEVLGIVVMTSGGNDLVHSYGRAAPREGAMYGATVEEARAWIGRYGERLEGMVRALEAKFPGGCEIFIGDIYDPTDGAGIPWLAPYPQWKDYHAILAGYNAEIRRVGAAHENVHVVGLGEGFMGHGFCCSRFWRASYDWGDPTYWYANVVEDPNQRGQDAIRRLFLLEMVKVERLREGGQHGD